MKFRIIYETDLHSDCGLIAAAAWNYLTRHGVKACILNIRYGKEDGHTIVVYESDGRICTYDHDGSLIFDKNITWETKPIILAKLYAKVNNIKKKVIDGKWFSK